MGFMDTIKGWFAPQSAPQPAPAPSRMPSAAPAPPPASGRNPDEVAIERYRYMLRTAPPETIEQAHAEAFAKLTPEQRQQVLAQLSADLPESERARSAEPQDLARMATRAEINRPGTMERTFGGRGGAPGMGSMFAGSMLGTIAGVVIGTAIADAFFIDDAGTVDAAGAEDTGGDAGSEGGDAGGGRRRW